ncbi:MAG: hypothetical protein KA339_02480 [Candidatus Kapabacteria bacterium]|nr:hypothetical protein [Ignavibacteria bacterium]MBP6509396.1 hypothetical protein [Candidatus Kapabacteria bacterium]MBP7094103.1 hypothetical protein [Candidatus Kapabacteria bacterium]
MTTLLTLSIITLSSLFLNPDSAARPVEEACVSTMRHTVLVDKSPIIKIDCDAGDIRIVSWLSDKVTVQSSGSEGILERSQVNGGSTVLFHHKEADQAVSQDILPAIHTIYVPANAVVEVFLAAGNVTVDGALSNLSVNVDRGNVILRNVAGTQEILTADGTITRENTGDPTSMPSETSL